MANEVIKLHGVYGSPPVFYVQVALRIKGIEYEFIEEDFDNKSADLLKYNPVHKMVPVLVHNGKPIAESHVIVDYIDEVWSKGKPMIFPHDAYEKAQTRFWAKFMADTCFPAIFKAFRSHGDEETIAEAHEQLQFLENELKIRGKKFFGGDDDINMADISASFFAFWFEAAEEAMGIKLVTRDKYPKLMEWSDNYVNYEVVKDVMQLLPKRGILVDFFKKRFG